MGRPTKLNEEMLGRINYALRLGATYQGASEYAGISYQTFLNWMARGEKARQGHFFEFFGTVKRANAEARVSLLGNIQKAALEGDWRAAAWILERRFTDEYGQRVKQEITGADGGPIQIGNKISIFEYGAVEEQDAVPSPRSNGHGKA